MREQEINETKTKLYILDDEITNTLEKLDVSLTTLEIRCSFCIKPRDFQKERELSYQQKKHQQKTEIEKSKK